MTHLRAFIPHFFIINNLDYDISQILNLLSFSPHRLSHGCLGHLNFSFQLQNTTLSSPSLVSPRWVCSRGAILRWLSSHCQQSHPLYPSVFNQAGQKVQPSTITINFSFISSSSSSSPLVILLALPASSFPHLCSQFHFNFLCLLLPPQTYDSKYLCIPITRLNPQLWRGLYDPASFFSMTWQGSALSYAAGWWHFSKY